MPPAVLGLVLVAAILHVTWNVILKTSGDPLDAATIGIYAATLVSIPIALAALAMGELVDVGLVVALATLSGLVGTAFFVLLSAAYRRGDLSLVYPTARGTAPLVAVAIGVLVLGERLGPLSALGVAALLIGLLLLQRPWRIFSSSGDADVRSASLFAVAGGVAIAGYSAIDRVGVRLGDPWLYAALLWPAHACWLTVVLVLRRRLSRAGLVGAPFAALTRREITRGAVGGLLIMATYSMILVAYLLAPLAIVSPLRESAIVLATAWGVVRMGEAADRADAIRRVVAAAVILLGIALLVVAG